jgi:hypothetical protein
MKEAVSTDASRARFGSLLRAAAGGLLALGLATGLPDSRADAATYTFDVDGDFTDAVNGERVAGEGSDRLSWGGLSNNRRSAYVFDGKNPTGEIGLGSVLPVTLGIFDHNNYRIPDDTGIKGATLSVDVGVNVGGVSQKLSPLSFALTHDETDNRDSTCANGEPNRQGVNSNGCADRIEFVSNPFDTTTFQADGILYTVRVLGFFDPRTEEKLGSFWTKEESDNVAELRGEISAVPVPAAGLLLLGALGGIGALASRRRR